MSSTSLDRGDLDPIEETLLERTVNARVAWTEHGSDLAAARKRTGGGLYIIRDARGTLCYVGETKTFADRLAAHRRAAVKCGGSDPRTWLVATGTVQDLGGTVAPGPRGAAAGRKLRRAVEHAVIRDVIRRLAAEHAATGKPCLAPACGLDNRSSHTAFRIKGRLNVQHVNPPGFTLPSGRTARLRIIRGKHGALHELWID